MPGCVGFFHFSQECGETDLLKTFLVKWNPDLIVESDHLVRKSQDILTYLESGNPDIYIIVLFLYSYF